MERRQPETSSPARSSSARLCGGLRGTGRARTSRWSGKSKWRMALRARRTCWRRTSGRSFVGREAFELTEAFEPNEEESAAVMWMFAEALAGNGYSEQAPAFG